jgi:hypothetical protein
MLASCRLTAGKGSLFLVYAKKLELQCFIACTNLSKQQSNDAKKMKLIQANVVLFAKRA